MKLKYFVSFSILSLIFAASFARAGGYNVSGKIAKPDGTPADYSAASFILEVSNSAGTCVIYREQIDGVNLANSGGTFKVNLGQGAKQFPSSATFTVEQAFANATTFTCDGGASYTSSADDNRKLRIKFYDGSSWQVFSPDQDIKAVPYATESQNAQKIGGFSATSLLRVGSGSAPVFSASDITNLTALLNGTSSSYVATESDPTVKAFAKTNLPSCTTGQVLKSDGSAFSCVTDQMGSSGATGNAGGDLTGTYPNPQVAKVQGIAVSATAPATGQFFKYNGTNWTGSTLAIADVANLSTQLGNKIDQSQMPSLCSASQTLTFSSPTGTWICSSISIGWGAITSGKPTTLTGYGISDAIQNVGSTPSIQSGVEASKPTAGTTGRVYIATDTNKIYRDNGTSWIVLSAGSGGTVTIVSSATGDINVATGTSTPVLTLNSGTAANQIVKLDASARLPALDGSLLTNLSTSSLNGILPVSKGGTNSSTALNNNRIMISNAGAIVESPAMTNGQLLIGSTGAAPQTATLTAGSGVSIANGSGSITISATGSGGTVTNVTSANSYLSVANATTTPSLTVNVGTAANTVAAGNDPRFTDARPPAGSAGGDLGGTYPNPQVAKIQGIPVNISGLQAGDTLQYNGSQWVYKRPGCDTANGWTQINSGVPYCLKIPVTLGQTLNAAMNSCASAGADICSLAQLNNACTNGAMANNDVSWIVNLNYDTTLSSSVLVTPVVQCYSNQINWKNTMINSTTSTFFSGNPIKGYCCKPVQ